VSGQLGLGDFNRHFEFSGSLSLLGRGLARMLFEILLSNTVEGKYRNCGLQSRSRYTPRAVRTAPAAEIVNLDPDQAFVHTATFFAFMYRD
jgi:hypothetical protein